jgi:hypothetical protein
MAILTNKQDVIANFHRYHGRNPNSTELAPGGVIEYLMTKPPAEVEKLLAKDSPITNGDVWSVYQQKQSGAQGQAPAPGGNTGDMNDYLNSTDLTDAEKEFLRKNLVERDDPFTSGRNIPDEATIAQWMADSAAQASADTDPYYKKITAEQLQDYKNQMGDIRNASQRYAQQEASNYKQRLASVKQNLRARGMTFSGLNRATLGKESAIDHANVEGTVPEARRMDWENQLASWQQQARNIGLAYERNIGSGALGNELGLASPYDTSRPNAGGFADYQAGRTQALYSPTQAGQAGHYVGFGETPTGSSYTSATELQRLRDTELAKQQKMQQYKLTF